MSGGGAVGIGHLTFRGQEPSLAGVGDGSGAADPLHHRLQVGDRAAPTTWSSTSVGDTWQPPSAPSQYAHRSVADQGTVSWCLGSVTGLKRPYWIDSYFIFFGDIVMKDPQWIIERGKRDRPKDSWATLRVTALGAGRHDTRTDLPTDAQRAAVARSRMTEEIALALRQHEMLADGRPCQAMTLTLFVDGT